tara:strand:+ start:426 stop:569 length:144 start_codon:yes stop_codon:yes gene_type:complete
MIEIRSIALDPIPMSDVLPLLVFLIGVQIAAIYGLYRTYFDWSVYNE